MKRSYIILTIIITIVIPAGIYYYNYQKVIQENTGQWRQTSGPFSINNSTYRLGDTVFMVVNGLKPSDIGNVTVYDPKGVIFTITPFNGTMKSDFDFFFKPKPDDTVPLCTPQELVGNWTIAFQGTSYKDIPFKIINEWVRGSQAEIKPIPHCNLDQLSN